MLSIFDNPWTSQVARGGITRGQLLRGDGGMHQVHQAGLPQLTSDRQPLSRAVRVQADRWLKRHLSITLCPLTSILIDAPLVRIAVPPSPGNGLCKGSQLMADKLFSVPAAAIVSMVGRLEASAMAELDLALRG
jgi:mRNA interferase MazF